MKPLTAPADEVRDHWDRWWHDAQQTPVAITENGEEKAFLISARQLHALEETVSILMNPQLMRDIASGEREFAAGLTRPAEQVFDEIDAELDAEARVP